MIKIEHIQKAFLAKQVLRDVTFEVEEGSIYGLIGKNGAGKTTLMKIMTNLLTADGGSCVFEKEKKPLSVGYLPDLPEFYDYLTTDEYLDYLLFDQNPIRRDKLLSLVSLPKGVRIKTMSRGMRQRLGIAAVLVGNPDVILLDEPTSALDPAGRSDVKRILLDLKKSGKTILLSTHILADMDTICDKAGFLHEGTIVKEVMLREQREQAAGLIVRFAGDVEEENKETLLAGMGCDSKWQDAHTLRILFDPKDPIGSQKQILSVLSETDLRIASIGSAVKTLDQIFREVCL
ncbi:MAG: ABC transporter ATP-binding protein [Lachnospiraceae bacterium]|nr:ABC transporter ATP-binding protein [Lachnospiraceae bacterium]